MKQKEDSFASAFPELMQAPTDDIPEERFIEEIYYLWTTNLDVFLLYQTAKQYLREYYILDTLILVELIKAKNLPMVDMLEKIPYLHAGFVGIVSPQPSEKESNNGPK